MQDNIIAAFCSDGLRICQAGKALKTKKQINYFQTSSSNSAGIRVRKSRWNITGYSSLNQ